MGDKYYNFKLNHISIMSIIGALKDMKLNYDEGNFRTALIMDLQKQYDNELRTENKKDGK